MKTQNNFRFIFWTGFFIYSALAGAVLENESLPTDKPFSQKSILSTLEISSSHRGEKHPAIDESPVLKDLDDPKACQYFLKTGVKNDIIGNDQGYSHGHLTSLTRICPDGEDLTFSLNSRFFTGYHHDFFKSKLSKTYVTFIEFQEENELTLGYTNWRQFKEKYWAGGLSLGVISDDKRYFSGKEHEIVHDQFGEKGKVIKNTYCEPTACYIERHLYDADMAKYGYHKGNEGNQLFAQGKIAVGKSFSLSSPDSIGSAESQNFFRVEVGVSAHSMNHASSAFLESEMGWLLLAKHLKDHVYLNAVLRGQKGEGAKSWSHSSSLGLNIKILPDIKIYYTVEKRDLPKKPNPILHLDSDEDILHGLGVEIRL